MDPKDVEEILINFVNEELLQDQNDARFEAQTRLLDGGELSSLGMMRLIVFIETELDVSIPLLDVTPDNFGSIAILSSYLCSQSDCHLVKTG